MAYADPTVRVAGDADLASDYNILCNNFKAWGNAATGKVKAGAHDAGSIATADIGALQITSALLAATSVTEAKVAAAAINQAALKSTTETLTTTTTLGKGAFTNSAFGISLRGKIGSNNMQWYYGSGANNENSTSLVLTWGISAGTGGDTKTFTLLYVQASPPYRLGDEPDWGHFVYLLRKDSDGSIVASWTAKDPPWNQVARIAGMPKNHPGVHALRPHPFWEEYGAAIPANHSMVLLDLRDFSTRVPIKPRLRELQVIQSKRQEHVAMGIPEKLLNEHEAVAQAKADAEDAEHTAMKAELEAMPETVALALDQAASSVQIEDRQQMDAVSAAAFLAENPGSKEIGRFYVPRGRIKVERVVMSRMNTLPMYSPEAAFALAASVQVKAAERVAAIKAVVEGHTELDQMILDSGVEAGLLDLVHKDDRFKAYREADMPAPGCDKVPGMESVRVVSWR